MELVFLAIRTTVIRMDEEPSSQTLNLKNPKSKQVLGCRIYWGYIGVMEEKMEVTTACWGYLGIV